MFKVLQTFEVPGHPLFEAGKEYDIIPNAEEIERRGLVVKTEKMIEKPPAHVKTEEENKAGEAKNSKRVAK